MAQTSTNPNNFTVSGFVAVDARINGFEKSAVARFPLSISALKTDKDGNAVRHSTLVNCEVWASSTDSNRFALLKKGTLVVLAGFLVPDVYTDKDGNTQSRLTFRCTSVSKPTAASKKEDAATTAEPKAKKAKAKAA